MNRKMLLGVGVDALTFEQALDCVVRGQAKGQVITVNPEMIIEAGKNAAFARILREAELVIPDGIGVELGLRILGHKVRRIPGIEFAHELLNRCETVALVGAAPGVAEGVTEGNIVYRHDGYFTDAAPIIEELKILQPALLLVAMGSPRQEEFIYNLKQTLPNTLMVGVGGSFDVWAGRVKRAPVFVQKIGLEWLWRTVREPHRFKRIFPALPLFLVRCIMSRGGEHGKS